MSRKLFSLIGVLGATFVFLWLLLWTDPFAMVRSVLLHVFPGGPENAKVDNLYQDPVTQEVTKGDRPAASLTQLASLRAKYQDWKQVYLIGNSQTYYTILAPGERQVSEPQKTYPDLVSAQCCTKPQSKTFFYRLAAPNITYPEALWYLHYLLAVPELRPDRMIVQVNYQTFRLSGIRDGMLGLLSEPRFRAVIESASHASAPYAGMFEQALSRYAEKVGKQTVGGDGGSRTGMNASHGFGTLLEAKVRHALSISAAWADRHVLKSSFLLTLYLLRVDLAGIKPTTPRSIGGASLAVNVSALEEMAALCKRNGVEMALLNAPQNPATSLYRTAADRRTYTEIINGIPKKYGFRLYDFEQSMPREYWGVWIDGPDPIHFGREGHQRMAQLVLSSGIIGN